MFTSTVRSLCINSSHRYVAPPPRRAYGMHTRVPVSVYFNQYPVDTATTAHKSWDNGECRGGWTNRGGSKYSIVVYTLPSMCATYAIQQWGISLSLSLGFPIRAPSLLEKFPQPVFIAKFHERGQDCIARRGFRSRNRPWLTAGWLDFAVIPQNLAAILGRGGRGTWTEMGESRDLVELFIMDVAGDGDGWFERIWI